MPKMEITSEYANANRIRTIDFARSGIDGTGTMSPRARRALAVYVVLIRMGFVGVIAPMGAIADAVFRSSHGESGSIRTLQRAHRELEERGYIRCAVHRPGRRARGAIVHFCGEAFSYWTQIRQNNVSPLPTQEHISADATTCRTPDRTRDQISPNSSDSLEKVNTEPRAGARASKNQSPNRRQKKNAVLFSVDKALQAMVDRTHRADRTAARARARCEVAAIAAGIALVNPSGVDWEYWGRRWTDMSWQVRESTAAREIIPLLLPSADLARSTAPAAISPSPVLEQLDVERPTAEQIREVRQRLEAQFSLPVPVPTESASRNDAGVYSDVDESDPEMQLLVQARARARARAVNGG